MEAEEREALFRRSIEGWNRPDWEAGLKEIWQEDGEIVAPEGWPEPGVFRGMQAMLQQWRRIKDSWADERAELLGTESVGEQVLGHVRWTVKGDASGAPLEVEMWIVAGFRDGRLSRMQYVFDEKSARARLEATG